MSVQLVVGDGVLRRYTFTWVDHLRIDLQQRDNGPSQPFTWEGGVERLSSGRLRVFLDFAGQGSISLECNEIAADG